MKNTHTHLIAITFIAITFYSCTELVGFSGANENLLKSFNYTDEERLYQLLDAFEYTVNEPDADSLKKLYLENSIPLIEIIKRNSGPTIDVGTGGGFANRIAGFTNVNLNITRREFIVLDDIAVSTANFTCCNGTSGTDLFFYVKQEEVWKIASMNVTNQFNSNPNNSYTSDPSPKMLTDSLIHSINTGDESLFTTLFQDNTVRVFIDDQGFEGIKRDSLYAKARMEEWCLETREDSVQSRIVDNYMYYDYTNLYDVTTKSNWNMMVSFVLSAAKKWRISTLIIRKENES